MQNETNKSSSLPAFADLMVDCSLTGFKGLGPSIYVNTSYDRSLVLYHLSLNKAYYTIFRNIVVTGFAKS